MRGSRPTSSRVMRLLATALALTLCLAACGEPSRLPPSFSDRGWWELSARLSDPPGAFPLSDNLLSNEADFPARARRLRGSGGVYIGVGPEQNFSYIAALRPELAFIVDIRRENRDLHLLYKALFELSFDRVDFLARLFSRSRPTGLQPGATVDEIFDRLDSLPVSQAVYAETRRAVRERLMTTRRLPLEDEHLAWIDHVLQAFHVSGPAITFRTGREDDHRWPSYRTLMTKKDRAGDYRSFLGSEEAFQFVKTLHTRNLIVPVVGDFGGPGALRRIAAFLDAHGAHVRAVYTSNVSMYLDRSQEQTLCGSLALLPAAWRASYMEAGRTESLDSVVRTCTGGPVRP